MRDALLRDLAELDGYEIFTTHDHRLVASSLVESSFQVESQFEVVFKNLLKQVDLIWLIAPETDGILLKLSEMCYEEDVIFLGCELYSTLIGTNKTLTYEALKKAEVLTIAIIAGDEFVLDVDFSVAKAIQSSNQGLWVTKPEDGAGCDGIRIFDDLQKLMD